jgi:hypothetical protein
VREFFKTPVKFRATPADQVGVSNFYGANPRSASIKLPSANGIGPRRDINCLFGQMNGKRLTVETREPVSVSTAVTVEYEDALFLGEVVRSSASGTSFQIDVKVEQVLSGLQSLLALRSRLLQENATRVSSLAGIPAFSR